MARLGDGFWELSRSLCGSQPRAGSGNLLRPLPVGDNLSSGGDHEREAGDRGPHAAEAKLDRVLATGLACALLPEQVGLEQRGSLC